MPASFPSSAKSFTTKTTSQVIDPAHVNDLQDEVTAIEQCLLGSIVLNATFGSITATDYIDVAGDSDGVAAFAGDRYSHVLVAAGLNANPLTANHQVGFYAAHQANSGVDGVNGFVCAFESAIGLAAGSYTVGKMAAFAVGVFGPFGAGAAATRTWNLSCYDQTHGVNNAAIAMWDSTFTGNWFIHYEGTRKSKLAGELIVGNELYRTIDTDYLRVAGGNAGGGGANILMFGATHASTPNQGQLNASGGWQVSALFNFSASSGITASTTQTQGQQALTTTVNEISTCANANDVVTLPAAATGRMCIVINNGAQTLQIYPASGDNLGAGVDASATLTSGSNRTYVAYDATNWEIV